MMIMEELTGPAGQTYMLRTPQPGQTRLWAMQAIAHGADGLLHFRWRSAERGAEEYWFGVLDHDNVPRERFEDFKQEGREMQKLGPQIVGSKVVSDIAVIKDFEDEWVFDYQFLTKEIKISASLQRAVPGRVGAAAQHRFREPDGRPERLQTGLCTATGIDG